MDIVGTKKDYKETKEEKREDNTTINALPQFEIRTMKDDLAGLGIDSGSLKGTKKTITLSIAEKLDRKKTIPPIPKMLKKRQEEEETEEETEDSWKRISEEEPAAEEETQTIPPENLPIPRAKMSLPGTEELIAKRSETLLPPLPPEKPPMRFDQPFSEPLPEPEDTLILPKREEFTIPELAYAPEKEELKKKTKLLIIAGLILTVAIGSGIYFYIKNKKQVEPPPEQPKAEPQITNPIISMEAKKTLTLAIGVNLFWLLKEEAKLEQPIITFKRIGVLKNEQDFLSFKEVFQNLGIIIPPYILTEIKDSYNLFIFSQETGKRLGIIAEINNPESLKKQFKEWEPTMLADLKNFYPVQVPGQPASKTFLDDVHQGVSIRYINLPYPTLTINYTILGNFLIIGTSKELMYTTIDRVLGK